MARGGVVNGTDVNGPGFAEPGAVLVFVRYSPGATVTVRATNASPSRSGMDQSSVR